MEIPDAYSPLLSWLLPENAPDSLTIRRGQFHDVIIGSERVVCLPRTEAAADRLAGRAAVLRILAGLELGFQTPQPLLQGDVRRTGEPPFLVLSRIPGAPLEADALDDAQVVEAVVAQYALLLAGLSRAGADSGVRAALPHAAEDRWRKFAAVVRVDLFPLMSETGRRRAERELVALDTLPHLTAAVVHGDLGAENALWSWVDGRPRLSGVVDWDEVVLGDPAEDLAAISASYGDAFLRRLLSLTGWSVKEIGSRIDVIRGTFALQQALSAHHDGDAEELADGLVGYR
ncbi:aminoglycoside phosphotransferase family protein [Nonomuraea sp. NPDC049784]|uniref:phosphotransferase family protein n=1 Tax=Nonomuraea sp. NPDC049784 TaxID=3154361 RepID=UPI0033E31056